MRTSSNQKKDIYIGIGSEREEPGYSYNYPLGG
jgi:hypothetical protein